MEKKKSIEERILIGIGITKGARELAKSVDDLQEKDSNIDSISFGRHTLNGYAGSDFLVANVNLKKPFNDIEEFRDYLKANNFPHSNNEIILGYENPLSIGFCVNGHTSDAFYANFSQPHKFRDPSMEK